jgi:hypothetical protein
MKIVNRTKFAAVGVGALCFAFAIGALAAPWHCIDAQVDKVGAKFSTTGHIGLFAGKQTFCHDEGCDTREISFGDCKEDNKGTSLRPGRCIDDGTIYPCHKFDAESESDADLKDLCSAGGGRRVAQGTSIVALICVTGRYVRAACTTDFTRNFFALAASA